MTGSHGETVITDMPTAMGGDGAGPNPGWLLRASMASCTATAIAMRAARLGITLSRLRSPFTASQTLADDRHRCSFDSAEWHAYVD